MFLKIVSLLLCLTLTRGKSYCSFDSAIASFKRPTYDFSVRILERVAQESRYHFIFSPVSTWIQLVSLAEGARGETKQEIWKITRYHRMKCFRRKYRKILNLMDQELSFMMKRTNVIAVNKLLNIKKSFKDEVTISNAIKVMEIDFNNPAGAVDKINELNDVSSVENVLDADDFNSTILLMTDMASFKSEWLSPFDPVYTSIEPFYLATNISIGNVRMMSQLGNFNLTEVSSINARVLELPFNTNGRFSMLMFLPNDRNGYDLFHNLKNIRISTILSLFKLNGSKQVMVKLPRFKITSEIRNIPELIYDMGASKLFYQELADFKDISDFQMHTSIMKQIADIEITEKGVSASAVAQSLTRRKQNYEFIANRPFGYLIVDKKTEVILFGGMYREPTVY